MIIRRLLIITASASVFALLAILIISAIDKQGLEKIELVSYPSDAMVSINGAEPTVSKEFYLKPGRYTAAFEREGFSKETIRIDTELDGDYPLLASLLAQSKEAEQWEEDNKSERERFETLSSGILRDQGEDQRGDYPIIRYLPSKSSLYSIGYVTNDDRSIVVTIHAPDVYVPYAINQIENWGIDPEDYEIDFVNQRNVFENE